MLLTQIKKAVLDILFPPVCAVCGREAETFLCGDCFLSIERNSALHCPLCHGRIIDLKHLCHPQSLFILGSAGSYDNTVLQKAIHAFKYQNAKVLAEPLSALLIDYLNSLTKNWDLDISDFIIVPIPLHPRRLKERGFNQSLLLANAIGSFLNLPVVEALRRTKNNKPQVDVKGRLERLKNIADAFSTAAPEAVAKRNILLIDDVFTSGATMTEAARVLKTAGAQKIIALVLAKA